MSTHLDLEAPAGWYLYRFKTRIACARGCKPGAHPLYIGISNEPWRREKEHQEDKWWYPYACGWDTDERVFATKAEALAAEKAAIKAECPIVNDVHNRDNPCRLVFHHATTPVRARSRRQVTASRPYAPATRWSPARVRSAGIVGTWLTLEGVGWWQASTRLGVAGWHAPALGALAATVLMALVALIVAEVRSWWRSRRGRNQRRRWAAVMVRLSVTAGVMALLWLLAPTLLAHLPTSSPR